jgi:hypothetical protein
MVVPLTTYGKASTSVLDYGLDWSGWLSSSEALSCSVWVVESGLNSSSVSTSTSISSVWISGGTVGQSYEAANTIWTDSNPQRKTTRTIKIVVMDK